MRNPLRPSAPPSRPSALGEALKGYRARPSNEAAWWVIMAVRCPGCGAAAEVPCHRGAWCPDPGEWHRGWTGPAVAGRGSPYFHARRVEAAEKAAGGPLWRPLRGGHEAHRAIRYALEDLVSAAQGAYEQTSLNPKMTQVPDLTYVWEAVAKLTDAEARGGYR